MEAPLIQALNSRGSVDYFFFNRSEEQAKAYHECYEIVAATES